ncbi:MAG: hypothetical protein ABJZ75_08925, partial [Luteolibacter sp.]
NSDPSATAKRLADNLISHIKDMPMADLQNWTEDIQEVRKKAVSANKLPLNIRNAGYNIWDDAQFQTAWDELSVYLPRKLRKAGLEAFVEGMDPLIPKLQVSAAHLNENPFWDEGNRKAAAVIAGEVEEDEPIPISRYAPIQREVEDNDQIPF